MEKSKLRLSFEEKKSLLKELFESLVNPDKGLSSRKCVMQHWYQIQPGLRDNSETVSFGLREYDGALCIFDQLPHGTENSDEVHVFDEFPSAEIAPKENNAGFDIRMNNRSVHSVHIMAEVKLLQEIASVYTDFIKRYNESIEKLMPIKET